MSARKDRPVSPGHKDTEGRTVTHIRRCHVCGTVNESEGSAVQKCSDCGKHLAPFYYFEESQLEGLGDQQLWWSQFKDTQDCRPIYGFSTYWTG